MKSIDDYFIKSERDDKSDHVWMRYRLIDEESSNGFGEFIVEEFLEARLLMISHYGEIFSKKPQTHH